MLTRVVDVTGVPNLDASFFFWCGDDEIEILQLDMMGSCLLAVVAQAESQALRRFGDQEEVVGI